MFISSDTGGKIQEGSVLHPAVEYDFLNGTVSYQKDLPAGVDAIVTFDDGTVRKISSANISDEIITGKLSSLDQQDAANHVVSIEFNPDYQGEIQIGVDIDYSKLQFLKLPEPKEAVEQYIGKSSSLALLINQCREISGTNFKNLERVYFADNGYGGCNAHNCPRLKYVYVPDSIGDLVPNAFYNLPNIEAPIANSTSLFYLPDSLTGEYNIPEGITTVYEGVIKGKSKLSKITFPSTFESFYYTFYYNGCTSLKEMWFYGDYPENLADSIAYNDFPDECVLYVPQEYLSNYQTELDGVLSSDRILPLIKQAEYTFDDGSTKTVYITGRTSITQTDMILASVGKVIQSVSIGEDINKITAEAFSGCTGLTGVTVLATTPPLLGIHAFDDTNDCPIYVPAGSLSDYQNDQYWGVDYGDRLEAIS